MVLDAARKVQAAGRRPNKIISEGIIYMSHYQKTKSIKKMDFENPKSADQFPFPQPQNTFLVSNATPLIDFSLNMLAKGHIGPTIRIFVDTQPLNFPVFNRVHSSVLLDHRDDI